MTLLLKKKLIDLSTALIMGIVNTSPDSFYAASRQTEACQILKAAEKQIIEGAGIIDIGAYSSRPSASHIDEKEEIRRISIALESISKNFPDTIVSVDTFRSEVARFAVREFGVSIINDISGGTLDSKMFETVAELQVAYVLMHMRGTPQTMQNLTDYENISSEIIQDLQKKTNKLRALGVNDLIIDPGFGFAKNLEQNYQLLKELSYFSTLNAPILVGVSRKSMIYKLLETDADHALNGTTAINMLALEGGASILRVHDVKEAVEAVKIFEQYKSDLK